MKTLKLGNVMRTINIVEKEIIHGEQRTYETLNDWEMACIQEVMAMNASSLGPAADELIQKLSECDKIQISRRG